MIQDIAPHVFDRSWHADYLPRQNDLVFAFRNREILCAAAEQELRFPQVAQVAGADETTLLYLFEIDGHRIWWWQSNRIPHAIGFGWYPLSRLRSASPLWASFAASTAAHLAQWYEANKYCGRCSSPMQPFGPERAMRCPVCGNLVFPRISPAVIIGLTDGKDRIVVSRYAGRAYKGLALLAGFIEIGETPEQTVAREVAEEVGLEVCNIRYVASQPWGVDGDLLLGYFADCKGNSVLKVDHSELAEACWVSRDELEAPANTRTLTNTMIEMFRLGKEPKGM